MDLGLSGKSMIVTGASRGIGLAVTRALVGEGASVVAVSKGGSAELKALEETGEVLAVMMDLTDPQGPPAVVEAAISAFGGLDGLVNNVGAVRPRVGGFLSVTDDDWDATLMINLLAAVRMTRAALPHLVERGAGSIVTVSSVNAVLPDPLVIDYSAAKAALSSFCKALSKEVGPSGVRVNTVSPGPVATALWLGEGGVAATVASATGGDPGAVADQAARESVTGRFTRPEEVADLVVFLAGDRATNVTGTDFTIDGGLISTL
jgi:NAD(P)-dependent dehydrogenase (short-subunit alcohol dehydrogenase family)